MKDKLICISNDDKQNNHKSLLAKEKDHRKIVMLSTFSILDEAIRNEQLKLLQFYAIL